MKKISFILPLSVLLLLPIGIKALSSNITYGSLIKGSGSAIYYYASDGKRYAFPNEATYKTWHNDFLNVIAVSDSELASIPFNGNMNCKPGAKMLKIQSDPKVYAVGEDGKLRWVKNEILAKELYGTDWNKKIIDIPVTFFINYELGADIETKNSYVPATIMSQFTFVNINKNTKKIMSSGNNSSNSFPTPSPSPSPTPSPSPSPTPSPTPEPEVTPEPVISEYGTTYYVRTDGGNATQCTGLANTAYYGSGTGQACAWSHPFIALPPHGTRRISGGDTLIIANGSYMMGYGAPGDDNCDTDYPYDCMMPSIPSGTINEPTRILGQGWASGCVTKPELFGVERPWEIINLTKSNNIELQCLEITDHSDCVESHTGSLECKRNTYPFGTWAPTGILASDSSNVLLKNLNIHGLAVSGINAGRLTDWTLENVDLVANGWVGWDGDIEGSDGNFGTITFKNVDVDWNGCGESYPGGDPIGCWAQTAGGYGDGLGTGQTAGNWVIEDSSFSHNTSDGLDLLYHRDGGTITIRRTIAEGNAGDQIKVAGNAIITDSVAISNCGYFDGKPFTYNVDNCRSGGSAIALTFEGNSQINMYNNSVYGEGDCLIIAESSVNTLQTVNSINNIFYGNTDYEGGDQSCLIWTNTDNIVFNNDYSIIYNVKDQSAVCPSGSNDLCLNPKFNKVATDDFNFTLQSTSPAINSGYTWTALTSPDFTGKARPSGLAPDRGAYEY